MKAWFNLSRGLSCADERFNSGDAGVQSILRGDPMTSEQVVLIQKSFNSIHTERLSELFYNRLFHVAPELRALFPPDLAGQHRKMAQMLKTVVDTLGSPSELLPLVRALGRRHGGYGAHALQYDIVGTTLLWAVEQWAGPRFTIDVREAWAAAYSVLSSTMQDAAADPRQPLNS
jgi:hemoglobin-like flavoprotein